MSELDFIRDLTGLLGRPHPALREGIGDDCAVLDLGGVTLLLTIDAFVEEIHFRRGFASPRVLGSRAAAAALSDIAAMGGEATALLVSAALGPTWSTAEALELARGIDDRAAAAGAAVVGGDTTGSPGPLFLDIAVIGRVPERGRALLRRGAAPGDLVAVTGTPGESGLGLLHLMDELTLPAEAAARAISRHLDPTPRLAEGRVLAASDGVRAACDISDGVARDTGHLAEAAGLAVELDPERFPWAPALETFRAEQRSRWLQSFLGGGEDYELAVALAPGTAEATAARVEAETGTRLTVIGRFVPTRTDRARVHLTDGTAVDNLGFEHLQ